jgi:hypothetical protein
MSMVHVIIVAIILLTVYWSFLGLVQLLQRYNTVLVILYLFLLFPIAYLHMLVLGIFGASKKERMKAEIKQEAEKQIKIEQQIEQLRDKK